MTMCPMLNDMRNRIARVEAASTFPFSHKMRMHGTSFSCS